MIFTPKTPKIEVGGAAKGAAREHKINELKKGDAMKTKLLVVKLLILLMLTLTVAAPQVQAAATGSDAAQTALFTIFAGG